MTLYIEAIIFAISIFILSKASHTVIKSSVKIARITKLGELVVGFLILSLATVLPELIISTTAVISGNFGIAIGNILGSNITCLLLIAGVTSFIRPVNITERTLAKLSEIMFLSSLILLLLVALTYLSKVVGFVLIILFFVFSAYSLKKKITLGDIRLEEPLKIIPRLKISSSLLKSILFLIAGMIIVSASAWFAVNSASNIASDLRIDQSFIGATIMAVGASLPELSVAITAQKERRLGLGLGNTIGSGLTRLTLVLGIVLLIAPFSINIHLFNTLVAFVLLSSLLLWFFLGSLGRKKLDRMEGTILLVIYVIFLILSFSVSFPGLGLFSLILK